MAAVTSAPASPVAPSSSEVNSVSRAPPLAPGPSFSWEFTCKLTRVGISWPGHSLLGVSSRRSHKPCHAGASAWTFRKHVQIKWRSFMNWWASPCARWFSNPQTRSRSEHQINVSSTWTPRGGLWGGGGASWPSSTVAASRGDRGCEVRRWVSLCTHLRVIGATESCSLFRQNVRGMRGSCQLELSREVNCLLWFPL